MTDNRPLSDRNTPTNSIEKVEPRESSIPGIPEWYGPLLRARLEWEAANLRPDSLRRIERGIVQALVREGFGRQYQVTREDGFEIAVDDLLIRVEHAPEQESPRCGEFGHVICGECS